MKPLQLIIRFALTTILVWAMSTYLDQYFVLSTGLSAYITVSALLTLMNIIVRPILHILTAPFHLVFGILATITVNWFFLWLTMKIAEQFDPHAVQLLITGGIAGWLLIAVILGVGNWVFKEILS